jgi:putative Holliday junction resolvase
MIYQDAQAFLSKVKESQTQYKLMALDVGQKKIGLATFHSLLNVVLPLKVLLRNGMKADIIKLADEIKTNSISGLVIGLPLSMSGEASKGTEFVINFANKLAASLDIPIAFYDERLTTKLANTMLLDLNLSRKERNNIDDQISASIILEDFIRLNNKYL